MRDARAELVRIDPQGVVHPIGTTASQRLRAREGAYRILPAPGHVVMMRFTGEDGRRDAEDGAIVKLAGEITAPGTLCDVLALIGQTGWRGELIVLDGESSRVIFFDSGNVVGAQTTVDDERLGMVMYRFGAIDEAQHEAIMERVRSGARFGQAAIELGLISEERLYKLIGKQIDEIVFATFTVSDGTFFFLDGFDEARLASHHTVSANALLMDGVTRLDEMRYFRARIPSSDHVPQKEPSRGTPDEEFLTTWEAIDGAQSIEELGRATGRGEFATTKDVYAMLQSKHVTLHPPRMSGGPMAVVAVANLVLERVHQVADAAGKGTVLRQSIASFAVGGGVYDVLFMGAGPIETGALDPQRVADNSVMVSGGADPERFLKQSLHEYVSFALFAASNALGAGADVELEREVSGWVTQLRA
ncbi:MAG: DUF4388 domain-containing protein [Polyangiaceae bacterium]|nr:DUF4388 domain-containing protein [Polyangiaceae bacterium]MCW5791148.1 DUF4388 domain-containing protein [Polyangiaceae bacterium]